ncbi:MAG: hypothetical protein AB7Q29_19500 [Vicinamibacterales bacterium]
MTGELSGVVTPAAESAEAVPSRPVREAFTLPLLFITVIIAGGFRVAPTTGTLVFVAPSLVYLLLALLVLALLIRSGALDAESLMSSRRGSLANLSGAVVLVALTVAGAQVLNAVTPESGLLHLVGVVFAAMLLFNTLAVTPAPVDAIRSLVVICGGLLVFKHVLLAALANPEGGFARRAIGVLLEGVTLGELRLESLPPAAGYVAFGTAVLYFIALMLLPRVPTSDNLARGQSRRAHLAPWNG